MVSVVTWKLELQTSQFLICIMRSSMIVLCCVVDFSA